ncbi:transcriptional regulator [Mesorhizobium sp. Root552]|jgi:heme exporter protein D|uniref:heme exporter protein CcmD n=1 Tax=Mesorhizobium sp. Root552 TaxID=1736555 RepID=UPI0006F8B1DE|nr:heme exporter protein CcmD [Mesorhizobium sp. Root552]KQZ29548.1 transcriptional regulator [Mesorhizobium sp. Root552]
MSTHDLYVAAAYAATAVVLVALVGWILLDRRARQKELSELEASGIRRRSDRTGAAKS